MTKINESINPKWLFIKSHTPLKMLIQDGAIYFTNDNFIILNVNTWWLHKLTSIYSLHLISIFKPNLDYPKYATHSKYWNIHKWKKWKNVEF